MCARIVVERLDDDHLSNLVDIGVDEISWRKHHKYLTLVSDHETGKIVWGAPGKKAATLDRFFTDALPEGGTHKIEAVSMDLGPAFAKSVRTHAPQAVLCFYGLNLIGAVQLGLTALVFDGKGDLALGCRREFDQIGHAGQVQPFRRQRQ